MSGSDPTQRVAEVLRAHDINKKPFWGSWDEWSALMAERIIDALQLTEIPVCDCSPYPNRGPTATLCHCGDSTARQCRLVGPWIEGER